MSKLGKNAYLLGLVALPLLGGVPELSSSEMPVLRPTSSRLMQEQLTPIRFDGLLWDSSSSVVRRTLEEKSLQFVYRHEDGTLVYGGSIDDRETMVYAYFSEDDHLIRVNLLLDEDDENTNIRQFLEVRAGYAETYSSYDRLFSPVERESGSIDQIDTVTLAELARAGPDRIWSGWQHVDSRGDTTAVKIHLRKLSEQSSRLERLVTRIWYYSPRWFRGGL